MDRITMVQSCRNNRNNLDITAAIIEECQVGSCKTRIMNNANLSYALVRNYLGMSLDADLIRLSDNCYKTTEKGKRYLERYTNLREENLKIEKSLEIIADEKKNLLQMLLLKDEYISTNPCSKIKNCPVT